MDVLNLDSLDEIPLGSNSRSSSSPKPNLITRDPPTSNSDSSIGLDLIINKEKTKKKSPGTSPVPFSNVEEPKSSFSNNVYSKIDRDTPNLSLDINDRSNSRNGNGRIDSFLSDRPSSSLSVSSGINKLGSGSISGSPIDLKPPSLGDLNFDFDDDLLNDNNDTSNSFNNNSNNNYSNNNYSNNNSYDNNNSYGSGSYNTQSSYAPPEKPMTVEEMQKAKFELLCKLERLKKKGVIVPRTYTMNSDYNEIKYEYEKLHNERLMDNSVKMYRNILVSATTAMEYFNTKMNPFDFYLDGWSEQVHAQQHDYDEYLEEIYLKYQDKGSMPPELKLLLSLGGSAFMYHLSNTMFKSIGPSAPDFFRQNPEVVNAMQSALMKHMAQQGPAEAAYTGMMSGAMNHNDPTNQPPFTSPGMPPPRQSHPPSGSGRQMNGPDGLDSFLDDITDNRGRSVNVDL